MKTCSVDGCDVKIRAAGLCRSHYEDTLPRCAIDGCPKMRASMVGYCDTHLWRHKNGSRLDTPIKEYFRDTKERILERLDVVDRGYETKCWVWTGAVNSRGYGSIGIKRKSYTPHKQMFLLNGGKLTKEKPNVLHKCDIKTCCNPDHLYSGSQKQNVKDAVDRGLFIRKRGIENKHSKLTASDILKIRIYLFSSTLSHKEIGKMFNVTRSTITRIANRKSYEYCFIGGKQCIS